MTFGPLLFESQGRKKRIPWKSNLYVLLSLANFIFPLVPILVRFVFIPICWKFSCSGEQQFLFCQIQEPTIRTHLKSYQHFLFGKRLFTSGIPHFPGFCLNWLFLLSSSLNEGGPQSSSLNWSPFTYVS